MSSLGRAGDRLVVGVEQAVLVQLPAALERAVAQRDVVRLRAGEVLQRGAALLGRDDPQVGLEAAAQSARWPWCRRGRARARPAGSCVKASASDGVGAAREDVEVAAGLGAAPHAADRGDLGAGRVLLQVRDERVGHLGRARQQVTAGVALPLFDRLEDQLLLLARPCP